MQNILFRSDSSSTIGLGHIMRDLVLAKQFKDAKITFASLNLKGNANIKILDSGYNLEILDSNDKVELEKLIIQLNIDTLIIDNYAIGYKEEKYLKERTNVTIFVLDDTYEEHYCDILLNHNISAKRRNYKQKIPQSCELRCGSKYALLRDEFHNEIRVPKERKSSKSKTVFIAMGATDHSSLNLKILKVVNSFKSLKVILVTTDANKNLQCLQRYVKNKRKIELHINSKSIAKLMRKSDFGILTPSVSANEANFMKLPFIAIKTAENQHDMYSYLRVNRYFTLKEFNAVKLSLQIKQIMKSL